MPSLPNSIPSPIKMRTAGMPKRLRNRLVRIQSTITAEHIKRAKAIHITSSEIIKWVFREIKSIEDKNLQKEK